MTKYPLITIFILNWNRKNEVLKAIKSAVDQTYPNKEILVVDNGSTDGTPIIIRKAFPNVRVIELDKNHGCVGGRNIGLNHVKGEFVFYMDDDALLHYQAVENAYNLITLNENIGVVGGKVIMFTPGDSVNLKNNISENNNFKISNSFHGGVSLHRMSMYDKTGRYPENYFYGSEELYLSLKMLKNDYYCIQSDSIILWHLKSVANRDPVKELVSRQLNALATRFSFWPVEFILIYFFKSLIRHPYQALQRQIFFKWIRIYNKYYLSKLIEAVRNRDHLSRQDVSRYNFIKYKEPRSIHKSITPRLSYIQSLFLELMYS